MSAAVQLLAHAIAARIPVMAEDSPLNNADWIATEIQRVFEQELAAKDALLCEALQLFTTPQATTIKLGFACYLSRAQYRFVQKLRSIYEK